MQWSAVFLLGSLVPVSAGNSPMSLTGLINDDDGYVSNGQLNVSVDVAASESRWRWFWDHDAGGSPHVLNDVSCGWKFDAAEKTVTACDGENGTKRNYYWFKGSVESTTPYFSVKGQMMNANGNVVGEWQASNGPPPPTPVPPSKTAPVQVHLALGYTVDQMAVSWASYGATTPPPGRVVWSSNPDLSESSTAASDVRPFTMDSGRVWFTHVANMTALKPSQRYYYKVVSGYDESSRTFSFKTQPTIDTLEANLPELHLIYGDMGASDAFTLCSECSGHSSVCDYTTCATAKPDAGLISEINRSNHIVHVGDFAYNLEDGGGTVGDQFMANIEQVAGNVPYMVSVGNHENSAGSLAHFTERFRHMPSTSGTVTTENNPSVAPNNWFFSWDAGLVHYVAMSTELFFGVKGGNMGTLEKQLAWIQEDLEKANANRERVPWIVVHGHRSIYCSCDGDCDHDANVVRDALEEVFFKNGVDFFFNGHEHDYERSWPVYKGISDQSNINPKATIYVVTGSAGSHELHEPFTRLQPKWSSFRSNTFGYSRMYIYNHTHIHWQQVQTDPTLFPTSDYGRVIDDAWIVQSKHGPFDLSDPPSGLCPRDGCRAGVSVDHWLPLLNLTAVENTDNGTHTRAGQVFEGRENDLIMQFRKHNRRGQWKRKELNLLAAARAKIGDVAVWEDVHVDGNSDGTWADGSSR